MKQKLRWVHRELRTSKYDEPGSVTVHRAKVLQYLFMINAGKEVWKDVPIVNEVEITEAMV